MTLRDHMRLLRAHWGLIVSCLVLGLCGAAAVTYYQPSSYSAHVRMYVAWQITLDDASSARELALLAEQRVQSYQELARGDRVGQEVVTQLGLPLSASEVRQKLSAAAALDTVVLTITATDESPTRAADIANAAAAGMARLVQELEQPPVPIQTPPVAPIQTPPVPPIQTPPVPPIQTPPVTLRIVEPATPPQAPDWPNLPLNLAVGAAFGLLVGVGLVGLRTVLDDSVRTSGQLRSMTRTPMIGALTYSRWMANRPLSPERLRELPESEAVRHARNTLLLIRDGRKVVGVTSSVRTEGRTATLCNIAVAMADAGLRVLVLEADLRRPKLARYFGLEQEPDLRSVLISHASLDDAVQPVDRNLDVLRSAPMSGDPSALLNSKPMADLLATVRMRYDIVLVDVPPLLSDAAGALVASQTDGCVLVVRYGRTTTGELGDALGVLASASVRLLGTIMTMVPRRARIRDAGGPGGHLAAPADAARVPNSAAVGAPAAPSLPMTVPTPTPMQHNGAGASAGVTEQ
jgi:polysaccharide biosynthesis transport protein